MDLPVRPPVAPMLARLTREVPVGRFVYEPKWDGFRCLAFRDGDAVELRSRHDRPLGRYFPELVEAVRALPVRRCVLDGEIVLAGPDGFDFAALMGRLHPAASRVERLRHESPAAFVAFDLLALDDEDLTERPFAERRGRLEELLADVPLPISLTPATRDPAVAERWLDRSTGAGIDGIVAKADSLRYEPGRRAMVKVKHERTADCVLAGMRVGGQPEVVASLLLGLYDERQRLRHVGVVTGLPGAERARLRVELEPLEVALEEHPWRDGFVIERSPIGRLKGSAGRWLPGMGLDWVPLRPTLVCEVAFDQVDVDRLRHPARFRRWRPDRDAASCLLEQIEVTTGDLAAALSLPS